MIGAYQQSEEGSSANASPIRSPVTPETFTLPLPRTRRSSSARAPSRDMKPRRPEDSDATASLRRLSTSSDKSNATSSYDGWVHVDDETDYGEMLRDSINYLNASVKKPIPDDLVNYIKNTYAAHAISIVLGLLTGSGEQAYRYNNTLEPGFVSEASREIKEGVVRYILELPRPVTVGDWKILYDATLGTPAFQRHEKKHNPETQEVLEFYRGCMLRIISGEKIPVNPDKEIDLDLKLQLKDMPALFARYELFFNQSLKRKKVDFNEPIPEPKDPIYKIVANRLKLVGKTRHEALIELCSQFPQSSLYDIFVPFMMSGTKTASTIKNLKEDGLFSINAIPVRSPMLLARGDGGSGKTTLARALIIILGFESHEINAKEANLTALLGPATNRLLKDMNNKNLEEVFGILPVRAMRAKYLDIAFNLDNFDLDQFEVGAKNQRAPQLDSWGNLPPPITLRGASGTTAGSEFQELLDVDTVSMKFKSLGGVPLLTIGWLLFASTNKHWPEFPRGNNAAEELRALRTRIREVTIQLSTEQKIPRLHVILDEMGIPKDSELRNYIPFIASSDESRGGIRYALRATIAVARLMWFISAVRGSSGSEGLMGDKEELIKEEIRRFLQLSDNKIDEEINELTPPSFDFGSGMTGVPPPPPIVPADVGSRATEMTSADAPPIFPRKSQIEKFKGSSPSIFPSGSGPQGLSLPSVPPEVLTPQPGIPLPDHQAEISKNTKKIRRLKIPQNFLASTASVKNLSISDQSAHVRSPKWVLVDGRWVNNPAE